MGRPLSRAPRALARLVAGRRVLTAWITNPWIALAGRPVRLPDALLRAWPELGAARWRCGGLPPRVGGWCLGTHSVDGITLGRTVFLAPHAGLDPGLLLHEVRHVQQFAAASTFPLQYAWESARRGYRRNRFEVDAVRYAAHRLRPPAQPSTEDA